MSRSETNSLPDPKFDFDSGSLCLDFANTLSDRPTCTGDKLSSHRHLISWGVQAGVLENHTALKMRDGSIGDSDKDGQAFRKAIAFREVIYRVFSAIARGEDPSAKDLSAFNRLLAPTMGHLRVAADSGGFSWQWKYEDLGMERILWPVARSAAELLVSEENGLVRECASNTCSWLFLDRSRNRKRRWCDMNTCGNRAKARRHYRRKKGLGTGD